MRLNHYMPQFIYHITQNRISHCLHVNNQLSGKTMLYYKIYNLYNFITLPIVTYCTTHLYCQRISCSDSGSVTQRSVFFPASLMTSLPAGLIKIVIYSPFLYHSPVLLSGLTAFSAVIIYTLHRSEILQDPSQRLSGSYGYCYVLGWLCVPMLLGSGIIYIHLRKKE